MFIYRGPYILCNYFSVIYDDINYFSVQIVVHARGRHEEGFIFRFSLFLFIASEDQIVNMHIRSKNFNPTELSLVFEVLTALVP